MQTNAIPKRGGALLIAVMLLLAAVGVQSAVSSAGTVSASSGGDDNCYEQVVERKYERPVFKTKFQYVKQTHERFRERTSDPWGAWSEWTIWDNGSRTQWSFQDVEVLEEGDHDGQNDDSSEYDRDYRYVKSGNTEQVPDGSEYTEWVSSPPAGDGWVQIDERTVQGDRVPCETPVPAQPSHEDPCGPDNASWNVPADNSKVTWSLDGGNLIASTTEWQKFPDGTTSHNYGIAPDSGEGCPVQTEPTANITVSLDCEGNLVGQLNYTVGDFRDVQGTISFLDGDDNPVAADQVIGLSAGDGTIALNSVTGLDPDATYTVVADLKFGDEAFEPRELSVSSDAGPAEGCEVPPVENPCDPSTYNGSVEAKITATQQQCVNIVQVAECGAFSASVIQNDTPYSYGVSYSVGSLDYNYNTDASNVTFAEDENGGSVDVWYWAVGPESGFFTPLGLPWYNVSAIGPITVDTDCSQPPEYNYDVEATSADCAAEISWMSTNPNEAEMASLQVFDQDNNLIYSDGDEVLPNSGTKSIDVPDGVSAIVAVVTWSDGPQNFTGEAFTGLVSVNCESEPVAVVPPAPTPVDECGTENDSWNIPASVEVNYIQNTDGTPLPAGFTSYTGAVSAQPNQGFFFDEGTQATWSNNFTDESCEEPPVDVCPNIDGDQSEVPNGMVKDDAGNCVTPEPPTKPEVPTEPKQPTNGSDIVPVTFEPSSGDSSSMMLVILLFGGGLAIVGFSQRDRLNPILRRPKS